MTSGGFADAATGTGGASNGKTGSTGARPALMPRILAVDDDPTMHVYLRETLSRLEVDLRLAEDAAGFRALRAERTPDLSIIDVDLPDAGGHVLAQEIGASGEPMVFFSVLDTVAHRMRALEAGAMEYLVKPVSPREFVLRIANILDQTRRTAGPPPAPVSRLFAGCRFDPGPRRIAGPDGNACALTAAEAALLRALTDTPGEDPQPRGPGRADRAPGRRTGSPDRGCRRLPPAPQAAVDRRRSRLHRDGAVPRLRLRRDGRTGVTAGQPATGGSWPWLLAALLVFLWASFGAQAIAESHAVAAAAERQSLLSEAPSAPESPAIDSPEEALAAYRAGTLSEPSPATDYFRAHWFVTDIRTGPDDPALAVAIWQSLIARGDLWLYAGDRLHAHQAVGVTLADGQARPRFASGYALPVDLPPNTDATLVLRMEPLLFLAADVELTTADRAQRVAALRGMLFPALLGAFVGIGVLHAVLWARFGDRRNAMLAGMLAITFIDWFLWLGGPQALGAVTSRDVGFAVIAGATYAHTFAICLLIATLFDAARRRRLAAIAAITAGFALYVAYPLIPEADPDRFLLAALLLTLAQLVVLAAMALPAIARRDAGACCAAVGLALLLAKGAAAFLPLSAPGLAALNTAITAQLGHFDVGALGIEVVAVAFLSLSLWNRHHARVRAQEAAAREARLEAVRVAQICHDIRSPLHAVQSLLAALEPGAGRGAPSPDLARARGTLGSVRALVEDIVSAARGGPVDGPRDRRVYLPDLVERVAAAAGVAAREKGVPIVLQIDPATATEIRCDRVALERVLSNLTENALKAARTGPVEIAAAPGAAPGSLVLSVADDGPGLPAAARARLLGDAHETGTERPCGLGLTVVRTLAAQLGARLSVERAGAQGTRVMVELPPDMAVPPTVAGQTLRILMLEDDPVAGAATEGWLTARGHLVTRVESIARGVEEARQGGFDLALIDLDLEDGDGREAIRQIRGLADPVHAGLPVIVASGRADALDSSDPGLLGWLVKPFGGADLEAALSPLLRAGLPGPAAHAPWMSGAEGQGAELAAAMSADGLQALFDSAADQIARSAAILATPRAGRDRQRSAAHRLAGTAAIVGLDRLSAEARAFEAALGAASGGPSAEDRDQLLRHAEAGRATLLQGRGSESGAERRSDALTGAE